jgi:NitT/TauT family transport system permease protein
MRRLKLLVHQTIAILALLALWQLVVEIGLVDPLYVSTPTKVAAEFVDLIGDGSTYPAIWVTTQELLIGLAIGSAAGIASGIVLGVKPYWNAVASPIIGTLYTMPRLALFPLFVLWFGLGMPSKIALVVSLVYFSMLLNTYAGVREVDRRLIDTVKLMGGGRWTVAREVIVPSILPWLLAGLRVSLVFAVTGAVIGEMLAGQEGLGYLITARGQIFDTPGMLALLAIVAIMAVLLNGAIGMLERWLTFWKDVERADGTPRRRRSRAGATEPTELARAAGDLPAGAPGGERPSQATGSLR